MKVAPGDYTLESFLEYLRLNHESVFEEEERKKWLKVYLVLHDFSDWRSGLFSESETYDMGEVAEIRIESDRLQSAGIYKEVYYGGEFRPGLLLFFSSAIQEGYEQTLGDRIRRRRGITEAWISPPLFQRVWQSILEDNGGFVYRFTSRRASLDDTPARTRSSYQRRFSYTGDDGTHVVKEIQEEYGVSPESMYIRINPTLVIQITNSGFFSAREITPQAMEILRSILDMTTDELLAIRATSRKMRFETANMLGEVSMPRVASVTAGHISLHGKPLSGNMVQDFLHNAEDFSFLDWRIVEGSLGFCATVVDEVKGSIFDVSMTETEITMIPKHNTTFESFLGFLRTVREQLDERATLSLWEPPKG